jgi:hypothetical protein
MYDSDGGGGRIKSKIKIPEETKKIYIYNRNYYLAPFDSIGSVYTIMARIWGDDDTKIQDIIAYCKKYTDKFIIKIGNSLAGSLCINPDGNFDMRMSQKLDTTTHCERTLWRYIIQEPRILYRTWCPPSRVNYRDALHNVGFKFYHGYYELRQDYINVDIYNRYVDFFEGVVHWRGECDPL